MLTLATEIKVKQVHPLTVGTFPKGDPLFSLGGVKVKVLGLDEPKWLITVVPVGYFKGITLSDVLDANVVMFSHRGAS